MNIKQFVPAVMIGFILSAPANAADPNRLFFDRGEQARPSAYLGTTVSLARNARHELAPAVRLGIGVRHRSMAGFTAFGAANNALLELDPVAGKGSMVYFGGRRLAAAEGEGGIGAGTILLAVAAAAAGVLVISEIAGGDDEDDERCLIEPELCD